MSSARNSIDGTGLLGGGRMTLAMEAHNSLSARVATAADFKAIWASGLSIASQMGYRDCNEASWYQVVDVCRQITRVANVPVFVDADSGFGNFNNARILTSALHESGAAGLVLEDKLFPKLNSFVGEAQQLADIEEVCGKLRAVRDLGLTAQFALVA